MKRKKVCQALYSKPRKHNKKYSYSLGKRVIMRPLSLFSVPTLLISCRCPWSVLEKFFLEILKEILFLEFLTSRGHLHQGYSLHVLFLFILSLLLLWWIPFPSMTSIQCVLLRMTLSLHWTHKGPQGKSSYFMIIKCKGLVLYKITIHFVLCIKMVSLWRC